MFICAKINEKESTNLDKILTVARLTIYTLNEIKISKIDSCYRMRSDNPDNKTSDNTSFIICNPICNLAPFFYDQCAPHPCQPSAFRVHVMCPCSVLCSHRIRVLCQAELDTRHFITNISDFVTFKLKANSNHCFRKNSKNLEKNISVFFEKTMVQNCQWH